MNIIVQQMFEEIIISLLLFTPSLALTSLTYSNCPLDFIPANYNNSLLTANQNLANSIYSNLFNPDIQLQIKDSLNKGDLASLQSKVLSLSFLLPYILAASFFFLVFVMSICCCTFDRRCPPCESWRRNYIKDPYSKLELNATVITSVLFSAAILITTIVVFSTFANLNTDLKMVSCGLYYSLDAATNGDQANSWGGFSQIQSQIGNATSLLNGTAATINSTLSNNEWIVTGMQKLQDMNLALYTNNQNSVVYTPNPATTQAALNASTPIPTFVPPFILNKLGPNGTAGTMVTDIDTGLQTTQKLASQAYLTYVAATNLKNSAANITTNTNSNLQSISAVMKYLSSIKQSISKFNGSFISFAVSPGLYVIQAIFGLLLLASLLSLLGIVSTHVFDLLLCKRFVNGGWVLFGLLYFCILFVLFVFLAVGGLSHSFCEYFGGIIGSSGGYVSYVDSSSTSSFNKFFSYLDVCFFQDGNILKKFQLSSEMKTVSEVFLNAQTYLNMQTAGNSQYIDLTLAPAVIISRVNQMNTYSIGAIYDADPTDTSDNNPFFALANMNLLTNKNQFAPYSLCASDLWAFDVLGCTYGPSESIYSPSADTTNGLYFPPTGTLCISLNSRLSQSAPSIWTGSDIAQRYLSVRGCKTNSSLAYDQMVSYATSLTNYRDSRINLYKSVADQLSGLLTAANQYNTNMTAFTGNVNTFFSSVSGLNNIVTNQINGLTISANCTVIADSLRFLYNMYCVNFRYRSIKIVVCCLVLLLLMLAAVIVGSVFGLRYARVEKERKFHGAESETEIFKEDDMEKTDSSVESNQSE